MAVTIVFAVTQRWKLDLDDYLQADAINGIIGRRFGEIRYRRH